MVDGSRFFYCSPSLSTIELCRQLERVQKPRHSCRCHANTKDIGMCIWTLFNKMWLVVIGDIVLDED